MGGTGLAGRTPPQPLTALLGDPRPADHPETRQEPRPIVGSPLTHNTPPPAPAGSPAPAPCRSSASARPTSRPSLLHRAHQRVDLHRPAALQVLQHRGLVRADRRRRPRCAGRRRSPKRTPSVSPIACASSIIARQTARVPGSPVMTSSVAPVSALIGLKAEVAPELDPDLVADARADRRLEAGRDQQACESAATRSLLLARRLAEGEAVAASSCSDDAGLGDLGRRIDDAADGALRADARPTGAPPGSTLSRRRSSKGPSEPVEIPPGHAVDAR